MPLGYHHAEYEGGFKRCVPDGDGGTLRFSHDLLYTLTGGSWWRPPVCLCPFRAARWPFISVRLSLLLSSLYFPLSAVYDVDNGTFVVDANNVVVTFRVKCMYNVFLMQPPSCAVSVRDTPCDSAQVRLSRPFD